MNAKSFGKAIELKSKIYDKCIKDFLVREPNSVVINLGCEVDTKFFDLDNGNVIWYELSSDEIISKKKKFIQETDRYRYIATNVTDISWIYEVMKYNRKVMFVAENLFMNLNEIDVKKIIVELAERFPGSELICEFASQSFIDMLHNYMFRSSVTKKFYLKDNIKYKFGLYNSCDIEKWSNKIKFTKEWIYLDDIDSKYGWIDVRGKVYKFKKIQWTSLYEFK